jgi:hypothetical protein
MYRDEERGLTGTLRLNSQLLSAYVTIYRASGDSTAADAAVRVGLAQTGKRTTVYTKDIFESLMQVYLQALQQATFIEGAMAANGGASAKSSDPSYRSVRDLNARLVQRFLEMRSARPPIEFEPRQLMQLRHMAKKCGQSEWVKHFAKLLESSTSSAKAQRRARPSYTQ